MDLFEEYLQHIDGIRSKIQQQQERSADIAGKLAARLSADGFLYTFGTGHAHLLSLEIFYRAGGLVRVAPILDEDLMLHRSASASTLYERQPQRAAPLLDRFGVGEKDALLVISNSGRNALPVEMALEARKRGCYVVALTSVSNPGRSRHPSGKKLFEVADGVLDLFSMPGDACLHLPDGSDICPTSTVAGAAILQLLVAQTVELAGAAGMKLETFCSSNVDGGDQANAQYIEKYRSLIQSL